MKYQLKVILSTLVFILGFYSVSASLAGPLSDPTVTLKEYIATLQTKVKTLEAGYDVLIIKNPGPIEKTLHTDRYITNDYFRTCIKTS